MNKIIKWIVVLIIFGLIAVLGWSLYYFHSLPSMVYSQDGIIINNCNSPRDENAKLVCPDLFCKKSIIESKKIRGRYSLIDVKDIGHFGGQDSKMILTGKIKYEGNVSTDAKTHYKCYMDGINVTKYELFNEKEWKKPIFNNLNKITSIHMNGICFSARNKEKELINLLGKNNIKFWAGNNINPNGEYCVAWPPDQESRVNEVFPTYKEIKRACDESPICEGEVKH